MDVVQVEPIPPTARVQFDSGMALVVDERMKWEKMLSKESKRKISE